MEIVYIRTDGSNIVGLEPMQVDENPQAQTKHHQQRHDDFYDDNLGFMGFEL